MRKIFTKLIGVTLGLAMAVGVGVGVAANNRAATGLNADTTQAVALSGGHFSTDHIVWTLSDDETTAVTIQQLKGSSGTNVNSSYISAPRVYKGHVLSFVAATGYSLKSISITVNGTYYGNSMTAGTVLSGNTVTDNTEDVSRDWISTSGGTHTVASVSDDGLSEIYIQNVASESNVQLRIDALSITYKQTGETPVPVTYTVTYDANGGTGEMEDENSPYSSGSRVTVLDNSFTRDGYDFVCFNTAANGSGTNYNEGATFDIAADTTLFAQWEEHNTITISRSSVTDASNMAYNSWTPWTARGVSGYAQVYSNSTALQFNNTSLFNATAVNGRITSITMKKASGSDRSWTVYGSNSPTSTDSYSLENYTQISTAKTVNADGVTWDFPNDSDYSYFLCKLAVSNASYIQSIVVRYEPRVSASIVGNASVNSGSQWTTGGITEDESGDEVEGATYAFAAGAGVSVVSSNTTNGTFTAAGSGTVTVSATKAGFSISSLAVTVVPVPYIAPAKTETTGYVGLNETLSFAYGDLASTLSVSSDNTDAVTVEEPSLNGNAGTVQINFVGAGSANVLFKDGSTQRASVSVTVSVSSVTISGLAAENTVYLGTNLNLGATVTVNATGIYSDDVTWESDNTSVATVSPAGVVTPVAVGSANITISSDEYPSATMTCAVTVLNATTVEITDASLLGYTDSNIPYPDSNTPVTTTIDDVGFAEINCGAYGNGIQMRTKNGYTSSFYNTTAVDIKKIEFVWENSQSVPDKPYNLLVAFSNVADFSVLVGEEQQIAINGTTKLGEAVPTASAKYFRVTHADQGAVYLDTVKLICVNQNTYLSSASPIATLTDTGESLILRLGASISVEDWESINDMAEITDFGVMVYKTSSESNIQSETPVEDAYLNSGVEPAIARKGNGNPPTASEGYYAFAVRMKVSNIDTVFCAASFVVAGGHYYFFAEQHVTARGLGA